MLKLFFNIIILSVIFLSSCSRETDRAKNDKLKIFVSVNPQKFLVESIGGKYVSVEVMVPPGMDPHEYDPSPSKIMALSRSDFYILIGVPFEDSLIPKISSVNPDLKFVDSIEGIERTYITEDGEEAVDPHVWLSPKLDIKMAQNICGFLISADPSHAEYYEHNLSYLVKEFESADRKIAEELGPFKGRSFVVFHPAFGYFAREYGLIQSPIELDGKSPTPKQLLDTIKVAGKEKIKVVFIEPQFDTTAAKALANSIGAKIVILDPANEDIIKSLFDVTAKLKASFE